MFKWFKIILLSLAYGLSILLFNNVGPKLIKV